MKNKGISATLILAVVISSLWTNLAGASDYRYRLYTNQENYGIVIFPKESIFPELEDHIHSLQFKNVQDGDAVMRFGEKKENATFMMPKDVQEDHKIKKFVILQILGDGVHMMVGVYEQEFGLTLPQKMLSLEEVKRNLPATFDLFRQQEGGKRPIGFQEGEGPIKRFQKIFFKTTRFNSTGGDVCHAHV